MYVCKCDRCGKTIEGKECCSLKRVSISPNSGPFYPGIQVQGIVKGYDICGDCVDEIVKFIEKGGKSNINI